MSHCPENLGLGHELREHAGSVGQLTAEHFHRDVLSGFLFDGAPDHAAAALPDDLTKVVAATEVAADGRSGWHLNLGTTPRWRSRSAHRPRSEEHTSELQSLRHLVCRLL